MSSEKIRGHQAVQGSMQLMQQAGPGSCGYDVERGLFMNLWIYVCNTVLLNKNMLKLLTNWCIHVHLTLQIERADYQNRMWCKMGKVGDLLLSDLVSKSPSNDPFLIGAFKLLNLCQPPKSTPTRIHLTCRGWFQTLSFLPSRAVRPEVKGHFLGLCYRSMTL